MTTSRAISINLSATPYYHCVTRCVRRTYLCGKDRQTGRDYSHRKGWIVNRIKYLSSIFAIKVCAYAVMSNHYHVVLFVNTQLAKEWSDEQVKAQWAKLFPKDARRYEVLCESKEQTQERIALWRERLLSISWFMRCINEIVAKLSNIEDDCKGRFWEGRFKSQALLDEGALLSAMVYVDLNPIRAKIANTPEGSDFTSIQERINFLAKQRQISAQGLKKPFVSADGFSELCRVAKQPSKLVSFGNGSNIDGKISFRLFDYIQLVEHTGRMLRDDKPGKIPEQLAPIFDRLNLNAQTWTESLKCLEENFYYAIGAVGLLGDFASKFRRRAPRGIQAAKILYLSSVA